MGNLLRAFGPIVSDFLSTIVFILAVEILKDVKAAILIAIATGVGQFLYLIVRRQTVSAMQWMSLFLVLTLGSASLITADPRFVMIKPTIGSWAVAAVMLRRGWMLRYLPPVAKEHLPERLGIAFGYIWAGTVFAMGAANLAVAVGWGMQAWVWFTAAVPMPVFTGLFLVQYAIFRRVIARHLRSADA